MEIIQRIFRKDYAGEELNVKGDYQDGQWHYQKEFVTNPFDKLSGAKNALVIGNGISRLDFDLRHILEHRDVAAWNERSSWRFPRSSTKKLNTYGCNALYRNYKVDFLVATGDYLVNEIANDDYSAENVVYANKTTVVKYPGKFHFIPQDPNYNAGAIAAYLAAFDGHKKVFLIGFDGVDSKDNNYNIYAGTPGYPDITYTINEEYWAKSLFNVMNTYSDTEFIRVAQSSRFRVPERWKYVLNFRTIDFRQFVLETDL